MSEVIFSAENLTKQYRKLNVLNQFHMEVHRGDVYGFVGRNGAGKTTLLRILTGRVRQTGGRITLFGKNNKKDLEIQRGKIGAIIETPALYSGMTAKENLEVLRLQMGIQGKECIADALRKVGLEDTAQKKVKDFSLGMKQRLGLAMAFLGNRELLVLDEPLNGLDPEGIVEFREILKSLRVERGITILISSHMLSELSQLATCYGFIRKGKMVKESSIDEIKKECMAMSHLSIYADNVRTAFKIINEAFPQYKTKVVSDEKLVMDGFSDDIESDDVRTVIKSLIEKNIEIREVKTEHAGIEDLYLSIMNNGR